MAGSHYCNIWLVIFHCSIQDLKEKIRQRAILSLGPSIETHGETFLAQEVVVNLLQETKHAFERCHKVRFSKTFTFGQTQTKNVIVYQSLHVCAYITLLFFFRLYFYFLPGELVSNTLPVLALVHMHYRAALERTESCSGQHPAIRRGRSGA